MKGPEICAAAGIEVPQWITLRFERGARYYHLCLQQDLWGSWCLTRINGRKDSRRCRSLTTWPGSLRAGLAALTAAAQRRRLNGYQRVG